MFGAWRDHQGKAVEGVVIQQPSEQSVVAQSPNAAPTTHDVGYTALPTPLNPDGTFQSVYGPDVTSYLTQEDIDAGLAEDAPATLPVQTGRSTVLVPDEPGEDYSLPEYEDADGYIHVGEPPANVTEYRRIDDPPVEAESTGENAPRAARANCGPHAHCRRPSRGLEVAK